MTFSENTIVPRLGSWDEINAAFSWPRPDRFNMAHVCVDRWAKGDPRRVALILPKPARTVTFGELASLSNQFANTLQSRGFGAGDTCAILLQQSMEVAVCHFGIYKCAGIALPLFTLFGEDALEYRLENSGARCVVTDLVNLPKVMAVKDRLPDLKTIWCVGGPADGTRDFQADLAAAKDSFETADTGAETPALLIYTSGTTGPPKGVLHAHRVLLGHLPCIEMAYDMFPQPGDVGWTPADWAWMGGLMNLMMPCLYFGIPVVAHRMGKFDPEEAFDLIDTYHVRTSFLPPTALKVMQQSGLRCPGILRGVLSGGESLGADVFEWAKGAFGLTINEVYGQTECNLVLGNCHSIFAPKPGSMGRCNPGARVAVLNAEGHVLLPGEAGELAIYREHPGMFLEYWRNLEKSRGKFVGNWMRTGDIGTCDADGHFWFSSRDDDVISSAGYRVGPTEIENCLTGHPGIVMAAVIGVPDPVRGQVIKAFVKTTDGSRPAGLEAELIARVREKVSPHVAPRIVEFIDNMPMTATGKILRRELRLLSGAE